MRNEDYVDDQTTRRTDTKWIADIYISDNKNLQKKIDELLDENSKLTSRLLALRTIVERGLGCKFTYERIDKPFGVGHMSSECIDAYNTLQQIIKDYEKMFGGNHVTDEHKDW